MKIAFLIQNERAFQKQPTVFLNKKSLQLATKKEKNKKLRYVRNVGLGFKTPREVKRTQFLYDKFHEICN